MMGKLTVRDREMYEDAMNQLEAVVKLASANFPRTTSISIKTDGSNPHASMSLSAGAINFLIISGRAALTEKGGENHE